jgi:hypothetical protein
VDSDLDIDRDNQGSQPLAAKIIGIGHGTDLVEMCAPSPQLVSLVTGSRDDAAR